MDRVFIYIDKIRAQGKTKTLKMKWKKKFCFIEIKTQDCLINLALAIAKSYNISPNSPNVSRSGFTQEVVELAKSW